MSTHSIIKYFSSHCISTWQGIKRDISTVSIQLQWYYRHTSELQNMVHNTTNLEDAHTSYSCFMLDYMHVINFLLLLLLIIIQIICYSIRTDKGKYHTWYKHCESDQILVLGSQPEGDSSHKPSDRLPLLSARPTVTFPAAKHCCPLASTKLYCLVWRMRVNIFLKSVKVKQPICSNRHYQRYRCRRRWHHNMISEDITSKHALFDVAVIFSCATWSFKHCSTRPLSRTSMTPITPSTWLLQCCSICNIVSMANYCNFCFMALVSSLNTKQRLFNVWVVWCKFTMQLFATFAH